MLQVHVCYFYIHAHGQICIPVQGNHYIIHVYLVNYKSNAQCISKIAKHGFNRYTGYMCLILDFDRLRAMCKYKCIAFPIHS